MVWTRLKSFARRGSKDKQPPQLSTAHSIVNDSDHSGSLHSSGGLNPLDEGSCVGMRNRYRLEKLVGRGHFGAVWAAADQEGQRKVALKMLEGESWNDGRVEHRILQHLAQADPYQTQRVMRLFSGFYCAGRYVLVMPLLGPPLSSRRLGMSQGVTRREVKALAQQLAQALAFVHGTAVIHTDLKPDNILLERAPTAGRIGENFVIADFGNAFYHMQGHDGKGLITTRPYRSPEVLKGRGWKHATDMWSVGCILYEVYTGQKLFDLPHDDDACHIAMVAERVGGIPWRHQTYEPHRHTYLDKQLAHRDLEFLSLLSSLLQSDPERRMNAKNMCRHAFTHPIPASQHRSLGSHDVENIASPDIVLDSKKLRCRPGLAVPPPPPQPVDVGA